MPPKPHDPNFWGDWEEELRRRIRERPDHPFKAHSPEQQDAWRDFFHTFTGEYPEQHWAFGGRRFRPWHQGDVSFNPFVANLFSQGGGLLPLIVLHLLAEKPRYGNELMTLISDKTADQWVANPGAIYPLMTELEDRGLVEGFWDDPRKRTVRVYHLTEKGAREMKRVKAIVLPKMDEAIGVLQKMVSELSDSDESNNGDSDEATSL
ncbi:MAG TPA: PadR family transcriptional regulator [Phototrophicaceae bacterium]|nr:PadR family transcriptional regulator [Phototrophicaceae bacterium]